VFVVFTLFVSTATRKLRVQEIYNDFFEEIVVVMLTYICISDYLCVYQVLAR
jgi:hypothetical protein